MQLYRDLDLIPKPSNSVVTIGVFDGVHAGHQKLISEVVKLAQERQGTSIVITFDPHPKNLFTPSEPVQLLQTLDERLVSIETLGVDVTLVIPFTQEFADITAEDFVENILVHMLGVRYIVIGHDHRFGKGGKGDEKLLRELAIKYGFEVTVIEPHIVDGAPLSSTRLRKE